MKKHYQNKNHKLIFRFINNYKKIRPKMKHFWHNSNEFPTCWFRILRYRMIDVKNITIFMMLWFQKIQFQYSTEFCNQNIASLQKIDNMAFHTSQKSDIWQINQMFWTSSLKQQITQVVFYYPFNEYYWNKCNNKSMQAQVYIYIYKVAIHLQSRWLPCGTI